MVYHVYIMTSESAPFNIGVTNLLERRVADTAGVISGFSEKYKTKNSCISNQFGDSTQRHRARETTEALAQEKRLFSSKR